MVFKRRNKRSWARVMAEGFWPRGGWTRAAHYMKHRLRRLPDAPHRIARCVLAGVFISFIAALMATFVGNPITFPFIAGFSVELGKYLLGHPGVMSPLEIFNDFGQASIEFWNNITSLFNDSTAHWDRLHRFFLRVYLPFLLGGSVLGIFSGIAGYYISLPVILAYQNRRKKKLRERLAKRLAARELEADNHAGATFSGDDGGATKG